MIVIDAETKAIEGEPLVNPPKPVGMGIKYGDLPSFYLTNWDEMKHELTRIWNGRNELVFQNAPFDLRVIEHWFGLPYPAWEQVHDTKFLIYLQNPHAKSVSLKPSAARILDWDVSAKDELQEWILDNVKGATKKTWGAHISEAPPALVGRYCKDDCDMTAALFKHLLPIVPRAAYDLERELQPYLVRATQAGIRLDTERLESDYEDAAIAQAACVARVHDYFGHEFDVHNGNQLADALDKKGLIKEWKYTPTGKRSTARPNLMAALSDNPELLSLLSYTGAMQTCLTTYMRPWIQLASGTGRLHPSWNQVRGDDDYGTRTGRLSCSKPNLQNPPNEFNFTIPPGLPALPKMRDYLLPEEGQIWLSRDFSSQEMRLLAHFENGDLCRAFQANPDLDPHEMVQTLIKEKTGMIVERKPVKGVGFGIMYGMGAPGLSKQLGIDVEEARQLMDAYHIAVPGVSALQAGTQNRGRYKQFARALSNAQSVLAAVKKKGNCTEKQLAIFTQRVEDAQRRMPPSDHIRTIGGRRYTVEPAKVIEGVKRTFEYKLLNYLIQGSAADQTKYALLHWFKNHPVHQSFLCTVHDEINISAQPECQGEHLRIAMERDAGLAVPMRTTLATGPTWGTIQ